MGTQYKSAPTVEPAAQKYMPAYTISGQYASPKSYLALQGVVLNPWRANPDIWPAAKLSLSAAAEHHSPGWNQLLMSVFLHSRR